MIAPRASRPDPWRQSVIRWAAMLYANGYDVLAADRRDFSAEDMAGYGYPTWQQALGWKESEDVLAAGRYLAAKRGVLDVGLVGFSEGGQNTVLALALDRGHVFAARVPLLSFYAADDSLVPSFEAGMMAGYEVGNPLQATYEVTRGEHAYFFDRWWQQRAILFYFKTVLPSAGSDSGVT